MREWLLLCAAAAAAFELVLDFRILPPQSIDWIFQFASDTAQYYLAFAYYRNSAWHFPVTNMDTMFHPVGASFMLADGIPLIAIPLKAVSWALPADFQFYGAWLFSCVVLSAVFAKLLLERLLETRPLIWAGVALITLAPPFVARFPHCHLAAHWLLIAAFWTVLEERGLPKRRIWLFSVMSLFIQPYLFAIVSGILLGAFWVHRRDVRQLLVGGSVWALLIGFSAWALGYFDLERVTARQEARYHADLTTFFSAMGTSSVVPDLPMGKEFRRVWDGWAEGYAYLGLGGMFLLVALVAVLVAPRRAGEERRRLHPRWVVLGAIAALMACFAISPSPNFLGQRYPGLSPLTELLGPVTARFRSAGRFIWPLFYFILTFGLQAMEQWAARVRIKRAALAAALLLIGAQAADIGPWLVKRGQKPAVANPTPLPRVPASVSSRLTPETKVMAFDPPIERMRCPGRKEGWPRRRAYYPLALFGARNKLRVNTDFRAISRPTDRQIAAICSFGARIRSAPQPPPDVMLVTTDDVRR